MTWFIVALAVVGGWSLLSVPIAVVVGRAIAGSTEVRVSTGETPRVRHLSVI